MLGWLMVLQVAASPLFSSPEPAGARAVAPSRPTLISGRWQGQPVRVRIASVALTRCNELTWLRGVSPTRSGRCSHLGEVKVIVGGRELLSPVSAYADLGEVHQAALRATAGRLDLLLRGSEGAEDYGVTLSYDRSGLVQRRLYWPDGGGETTSYTNGSN